MVPGDVGTFKMFAIDLGAQDSTADLAGSRGSHETGQK
jgi:hypothetical protein